MKTKPSGTEVDGRKITEADVQMPDAVLDAVLDQRDVDAQDAYRQITELRAVVADLVGILRRADRTIEYLHPGHMLLQDLRAAIAKAEAQS